MTIAEDMARIADKLMADFGVAATYLPSGGDPAEDAVTVTVRCKPKMKVFDGHKAMTVMGLTVRSSEVADPNFGDVFTVDGVDWKISALHPDFQRIKSDAGGVLWVMGVVNDVRPGRK